MVSTDITWITTIFCPLLGVLIDNAEGWAPVWALLQARKNKKLGESLVSAKYYPNSVNYEIAAPNSILICFLKGPLNPIPFALITNMCLGWTIYAVLKGDYFIFMSNCFPVILGIVLCLTAVHILEHTDSKSNPKDQIIRLRVEAILVSCASFWMTVSLVIGLILKDEKHHEFKTLFVGALCDVCTLVFYAAPLTNLAEVIEKKDSSTLYAPAIGVNLSSAILWFLYGFLGINEAVVWIPSAMGIIICLFQLYICWYYPVFLNDSFNDEIEEEFPQGDYAVFSSSRRVSISQLLADITPGRTPNRTPGRTPNRTPGRTPGRSPPTSPNLSPSEAMKGMWLHAEPARVYFNSAIEQSRSRSGSLLDQDCECLTIKHECPTINHHTRSVPYRGNVRYISYVHPSVTGNGRAGNLLTTVSDTDLELNVESEAKL